MVCGVICQTIDTFIDDSNLTVNEAGVRMFNEKTGRALTLEEVSSGPYQGYKRYLFLSG